MEGRETHDQVGGGESESRFRSFGVIATKGVEGRETQDWVGIGESESRFRWVEG